MWTAFKQISDEALLVFLKGTADACVSVVNMPDDVRHTNMGKGMVSPNEAGKLSAMFATAFEEEARRRGLK